MSTKVRDTFRIRLRGPDITPESIPLSILARVLVGLEGAIKGLISETAKDIDPRAVVISLARVSRGSVNIALRSQGHDELVRSRVEVWASAVNSGSIVAFPGSVQRATENLREVVTEIGTPLEIFEPGRRKPLASIQPVLPSGVESLPLKGVTEIYGLLEAVGGAQQATARVRTASDGLVVCRLTRELAQELAPSLYRLVHLRGVGEWDATTLEAKAFTIDEVLPVVDVSIQEAVKGLAELIGPAWDAIDDPDAFLASAREHDSNNTEDLF